MAITGICAIVVAMLLLAIDPYRRPFLQRIAHAFWGGPIGAWLMGSTRTRADATGVARPQVRVPAPAQVNMPVPQRAPATVATSVPAMVSARVSSHPGEVQRVASDATRPLTGAAESGVTIDTRLNHIEARLTALEGLVADPVRTDAALG